MWHVFAVLVFWLNVTCICSVGVQAECDMYLQCWCSGWMWHVIAVLVFRLNVTCICSVGVLAECDMYFAVLVFRLNVTCICSVGVHAECDMYFAVLVFLTECDVSTVSVFRLDVKCVQSVELCSDWMRCLSKSDSIMFWLTEMCSLEITLKTVDVVSDWKWDVFHCVCVVFRCPAAPCPSVALLPNASVSVAVSEVKMVSSVQCCHRKLLVDILADRLMVCLRILDYWHIQHQ